MVTRLWRPRFRSPITQPSQPRRRRWLIARWLIQSCAIALREIARRMIAPRMIAPRMIAPGVTTRRRNSPFA
jgi:hypothetical protein